MASGATVDSVIPAADSEALMVALRNEHAAPFDSLGWVQLSVNVAPSPERKAHDKEQREAQRADAAEGRVLSLSKGLTSGYDKASNRGLLGSFANGPQAIWREIPADEETGRPAYYHSEALGVSQWQRPEAPPMRPVRHGPNDLQSISPRYQELEPHQRAALVMGEMEFPPPREPTAAELEEAWAQAQIAAMRSEEEEAEDGEGAIGGGDGGGGGAGSSRRLPLLSAASRLTNPGETIPKLRVQPTAEERQVRREAAKAERAAEAAKVHRVAAIRAAEETYERTAAQIVSDAEKAREDEARKEVEDRKRAARASAVDTPGMVSARAPKGAKAGGVGGGKKEGGAASAEKSAAALGPKPMPTPLVMLERQVAAKCQELRENDEERRRMMRDIAYQKRVEEEERRSAPGFKDFGQINQARIADMAAERKDEARRAGLQEERRQKAAEASAAAAKRRAELVRREESERRDGATSPSLADSARLLSSSARTPRAAASDELYERDHASAVVTRLSQPHGAGQSTTTAAGRARKLAAELAHKRY